MMKTLQKIAGCVFVLSVLMVCGICAAGNTDLEERELQEKELQEAAGPGVFLDENGVFPIETPADFQWFCFYISAGYEDLNGILLDDIDFAEKIFYGQNYRGHFDGGGHTISGVASELFVELEEGARVENLIVRDANIVSKKYGASGIVRRNFGEIVNCEVSGYIEGKGYTGGIASANYGLIENCVNRADVVSTGDVETYDYAGREIGCGAGGIAGFCGTCEWEDRHIVDCISLKGTISNTMRHENVMEISKEEIPLWETGKLEYLSNSWIFDLEDAVYTCSMEPLHVLEEDSSKEKNNYYLCEEFALCLPEYCEITEQSIGGECYALRICCMGKGAAEDGTGSGISPGDEAWLLRKQADVEEALKEIHESNTRDSWRVASFTENVF